MASAVGSGHAPLSPAITKEKGYWTGVALMRSAISRLRRPFIGCLLVGCRWSSGDRGHEAVAQGRGNGLPVVVAPGGLVHRGRVVRRECERRGAAGRAPG